MTFNANDRGPNRVSVRNGTPWNWIIGIAALVILGIIVWSMMGNNTNMASVDQPAATATALSTTGSASGPATPRPAAPISGTTGSAH